SPSCSRTIRTARSLTSRGYLFCVFMTPSSQRLESPGKAGRFKFSYDHSEKLGDAFEYLLSVLDPACGTAGFLISSWKHILKANTDAAGNSTLTPDDKGRLAQNFTGYDISPDMVRLSLVNMYLHGFADPHIAEYDTLTSQDKWNEHADVILANPPFMSPKGGIKPHNRFSVQSKRSEVLFVDYMAEHLTPSGRAGIIVPEGIIFQSQNAYKQLRKMLVEEYLVAVVSLPAGVFQPYSGVKTSILILDRSLARRADTIAFFKVENDGFGLGAQRREIADNDLPQVLEEVGEYLGLLRAGEPVADFAPTLGLVVPKEKVAANGDHNLSGERYRESGARETAYEFTELGAITLGSPQYGSGASKVPFDGKVRYVRITDLTVRGELKSDRPVSPSAIEPDCFLEPDDLLIARSGSVGRTYLHRDLHGAYQYAGYLIHFRIDSAKALSEFVFHVTQSDPWREWILSNSKTGTLTNINAKQYSSFRFPLPPLEVQKEIVAEIEGYQKVIDGARAVLDHYRPHIPIHPDWPIVELREVIKGKAKNGYSGRPVPRVTRLKVRLTWMSRTSSTLTS
ncbi:MAG: N-6 DNA methylase, partial [Thermoleophilia bacterium]